MKKNTFYILIGCIALALLALFIYSIETRLIPLWIEPFAFVTGILIVYTARKSVTDLIEDERSAKITENAVVRTFQVFWVVFCCILYRCSDGSPLSSAIFPRTFPGTSPGDPYDQDDGIFPAGTALPDDLPLCRLPNVLCQKLRGLGDR